MTDHYSEFREFPPDDRINAIGRNGNDGDHYPVVDQIEAILDLNAGNNQLRQIRAKDGNKSGLNVHSAQSEV